MKAAPRRDSRGVLTPVKVHTALTGAAPPKFEAVTVAAKCYADASANTVARPARLSLARVALLARGYWSDARDVCWRDRAEDSQHQDADTTRASRSGGFAHATREGPKRTRGVAR
jgi:hypothetical protein